MGLEKLAELKSKLSQDSKPDATNLKNKSNKHNHAQPVDPVVLVISRLQNLFPIAFPKKPAPKVPLKVGILTDLEAKSEEIGLSKEELRLAIKTWCKSPRYWSVVRVGAVRYDLNGMPAGEVEPNGAAQALAMAGKYRNAKQSTPDN